MQNRKTGTEATRLPSELARRGEQSTLSVTTLLAMASGPARRGEQSMLSTHLRSLWRVSLLASRAMTVCCRKISFFIPKPQF